MSGTKGHGRYSKRRLTRASKVHGKMDRLRARVEATPKGGWDRHAGFTMPGSMKKG